MCQIKRPLKLLVVSSGLPQPFVSLNNPSVLYLFRSSSYHQIRLSVRSLGFFKPSLNLALTDEPGDASPEFSLQIKKKLKRTGEQGTTSRQAPFAAFQSVAGPPDSSVPGALASGVPARKKDFKGFVSVPRLV